MRSLKIANLTALVLIAGGPAQAEMPVKIAVMAELSGPQAAYGQEILDSFTMVVERNGGKLGGVPVELLRRDTQFKPEVANQIADELIEREKVRLVVGLSFSNIALAVTKKLTSAGVVVIGAGAGPAPLAGAQCSPNLFVVSKQNDQFAEAMGKYASSKSYNRVLAIAPNYQAGKDFVAGFKRTYTTPLMDEVYVPLTQLDFSAEIARISSEKPDAVYIFLPGPLGISFVRAYQQAGLMTRVPLLSVSIDGILLPALKDSAIGAKMASSWGPDLPNAANRKFVEEFTAKYKRIPSDYAAQTYDAAMLLDSALAKTKGNVTDTKALTAAIQAADFQSVRGNFKFNTNHFPIQDFYLFDVVKDARGDVTLKSIAKPLADGKDAYVSQCPMK
jgi:branched-chain amino acid transport system substrate-binding protein